MLVASHESLILHPVDCTIATWRDRNFAIFVLYCADLVAANPLFSVTPGSLTLSATVPVLPWIEYGAYTPSVTHRRTCKMTG